MEREEEKEPERERGKEDLGILSVFEVAFVSS